MLWIYNCILCKYKYFRVQHICRIVNLKYFAWYLDWANYYYYYYILLVYKSRCRKKRFFCVWPFMHSNNEKLGRLFVLLNVCNLDIVLCGVVANINFLIIYWYFNRVFPALLVAYVTQCEKWLFLIIIIPLSSYIVFDEFYVGKVSSPNKYFKIFKKLWSILLKIY